MAAVAPPATSRRSFRVPPMLVYILRRLLISIVVVIGVSIIVFGLLAIIAGSDPAKAFFPPRTPESVIKAFEHANGFDKPLWQQYLLWVWNLLHGNFGTSYKLNQPVAALLLNRGARSALLSGAALFFAIAIAIPLGIFQAAKRNSVRDYAVTTFAFVTYSMPSFLLGLLLIIVFALDLGWFSPEAAQAQTAIGVIQQWPDMVLPVATLTLLQVAAFSRYMRSSALDVLAQDYINVAKAKGMSSFGILRHHVLRNAILPMVTLVGLSMPALLAGNLVTEYLFNFNGIGLLFFNALQTHDYEILLGYTLVGAVLTVLGNFIADIALALADPRIRLT